MVEKQRKEGGYYAHQHTRSAGKSAEGQPSLQWVRLLHVIPMAVLTVLLGMVFLPTALEFNNFAIVGPLFTLAAIAVLYIASMKRSRKAKKQLKAMGRL